MKVLHVITGLNVGGAETMLGRILDGAHHADLAAEVVTLMSPGFVGERMSRAGHPVRSLGVTGAMSGALAVPRLAGYIRKARPDVIMAWMHHAQLVTTLAAGLAQTRTPVIWNVRHSLGNGYEHEKLPTRAILRIQARLSRLPAAIMYNSQAAAQQYRGVGFKPVHEEVIPNGFAVSAIGNTGLVRQIFGISKHSILIGMIARAHPMKDVANLVSAFARLCAAGVPAHLLIVGEGMDQPSAKLAEALGQLPHGTWTLSGQRSDVAQWLCGLDILSLPSAWGEGFPNIVGEAMAQGVPCVGTDVGDTAWVIDRTGRSAPARNPAALACALMELCTMDAPRRKALGMAARQRIQQLFALDHVVSRYETLLFEAAAGRAAGHVSDRLVRREAT